MRQGYNITLSLDLFLPNRRSHYVDSFVSTVSPAEPHH